MQSPPVNQRRQTGLAKKGDSESAMNDDAAVHDGAGQTRGGYPYGGADWMDNREKEAGVSRCCTADGAEPFAGYAHRSWLNDLSVDRYIGTLAPLQTMESVKK